MAKQKIEVVELNLGKVADDLTLPTVSPETQAVMDQKLRLAKMEKEAIDRVRKKRQDQEQQKQDAVEKGFQLLKEAFDKKELVSIEQLFKLTDAENLSSFMLRLNNFIKKRGELWKIKRRTKGGKKFYEITPS